MKLRGNKKKFFWLNEIGSYFQNTKVAKFETNLTLLGNISLLLLEFMPTISISFLSSFVGT